MVIPVGVTLLAWLSFVRINLRMTGSSRRGNGEYHSDSIITSPSPSIYMLYCSDLFADITPGR